MQHGERETRKASSGAEAPFRPGSFQGSKDPCSLRQEWTNPHPQDFRNQPTRRSRAQILPYPPQKAVILSEAQRSRRTCFCFSALQRSLAGRPGFQPRHKPIHKILEINPRGKAARRSLSSKHPSLRIPTSLLGQFGYHDSDLYSVCIDLLKSHSEVIWRWPWTLPAHGRNRHSASPLQHVGHFLPDPLDARRGHSLAGCSGISSGSRQRIL